jgi:hypothetical protein
LCAPVGSCSRRPSGPGQEEPLAVYIEREDNSAVVEVCDHDETTEPLDGLAAISRCTACGKTWPTWFGSGAPTVRIVPKEVG